MHRPTLSICIATMNRPAELAEELATLLPQIEGRPVEVVVVDSSQHPVDAAWRLHPQVRVEWEAPRGVDRGFDAAVRHARGEYCWLLSDDDRIRAGAVALLLDLLRDQPSAVLLESVAFEDGFRVQLNGGSIPECVPDVLPGPVGSQALAPLSRLLTFIGCVAVRRSIWLERSREELFGYEFIHVGILLDAPLPSHVCVVKAPQIDIRYGVASWQSRTALIWDVKWPSLIDLLVKDSETRKQYYTGSAWHRAIRMLQYRGLGAVGPRAVLQLNDKRPFGSRLALGAAVAIAGLPILPLNVVMSCARLLLRPNDKPSLVDLRDARKQRLRRCRSFAVGRLAPSRRCSRRR